MIHKLYKEFINFKNIKMTETTSILSKQLLNKVPEVTIFFWIIKILCTTVGETASDFLNVSLGFGLVITSIVMGVVFFVVLFFKIKSKKYTPWLYWLTVFIISIFGTLVTDNLTDGFNVPLELSTIIFTILLGLTFIVWYAKEKTLSIHSIDNRKREIFYWIVILFTFALGTATGDLYAEGFGIGYLITGLVVAIMILTVVVAWKLKFDSILTFWIAYILTRPLGASIGDYLSQSPASGGLGLGPTITTFIFALGITFTVLYLSITKKDQMLKKVASEHEKLEKTERKHLYMQIGGLFLILLIIAGTGYFVHNAMQQKSSPVVASANAPLGDLSEYKKITQDTLDLVNAGKMSDAKTRITDLETLWDETTAKLTQHTF
ncbi:MAG: hypothetical protein WCH76_06960 [Candidatus Riflemargulisbacteria bacterium]